MAAVFKAHSLVVVALNATSVRVRSVSPSHPPPLQLQKFLSGANGGKYQPFVLDSVFQISEDEGRG